MLTILTVARGNSLDESTIEEELISAAGQLSSSPRFRSCPEVARQARDYLVAHREAPFRLSTMAEALGVDRSYLARAFRRAYGCTMGAYRRMLRLQCAMGLIADRTPLARAAISAGFADQSHLSRTFRQELGVTAAAYGTLAAGPEA
jgi:AraC-like DNA-binding protein